MIGTEIFSPAGEKLGYVKTVYLSKDRKKITCLSCVDEAEKEEGSDDEFVMPFRAVLSVKDVIIAKKLRMNKTIGNPAPVGASVYSDTGEALGTLCEISAGEGEPVYIATKNGVLSSYPDERVTIGKAIIVSFAGNKKGGAIPQEASNEKEEKEREGTVPEERKAGWLSAERGVIAAEDAPSFSGLDRLNLLGRQVKISVRDKNGKAIAESGERITPEILSNARRNNLLLRLTVNTLTNLV